MKQPPVIVIQLIHMEGPLKGEIQEFSLPEIFIGRSATCNVCFPKDLAIVSRVHARIVREGNRFMLMDQSTNGTFVNGKQVKEAILKDGDVLLFAEGGPKVSFLTQIMEGTADVAGSVQPAVFSAPVSPAPFRDASPPPAPMPPPEQRVSVPQPVSVTPVSPAAPSLQHPGDIPIQQVKKSLVVQYGPTLQSYNVLPVTIGSGAQCDFRLDHPAVFERHAQIFYYQEQYWIKDLTGKNLVRINGRSIENQGMLEPDHRLSLSARGPDFRFLGGGRLAEIEAAPPEESKISPHQDGGNESPGASQGNVVKQIGAMMKKMLKR
ncbi:MAG: FHA domain-containing protein [Deltaproteobacteria bacterium]|nr:FHA domain-containing protein [Deltaproteobacteria bacterium]